MMFPGRTPESFRKKLSLKNQELLVDVVADIPGIRHFTMVTTRRGECPSAFKTAIQFPLLTAIRKE